MEVVKGMVNVMDKEIINWLFLIHFPANYLFEAENNNENFSSLSSLSSLLSSFVFFIFIHLFYLFNLIFYCLFIFI